MGTTCTPADVTYPTDLNLLNRAREKAEKIIDILHCARTNGAPKPGPTGKNPGRTTWPWPGKSDPVAGRYGKRSVSNCGISVETWTTLLPWPSRYPYRFFPPDRIRTCWLSANATVSRRPCMSGGSIVSMTVLSVFPSPIYSPIKRGKAAADTEFGAKVSISLVHGFTFTERISWDNFNEGTDLIDIIKKYKRRFDVYSALVYADTMYRNPDNLRYCRTRMAYGYPDRFWNAPGRPRRRIRRT